MHAPALTMSPTLGDRPEFELNASYCREAVTLKAGRTIRSARCSARLRRTAGSPFARRSGRRRRGRGDRGRSPDPGGRYDGRGQDREFVVGRGPAIVSKAALVFDASVDKPAEKTAKHAQLAAAGIVPRDTA